ncbi:hypothetical protein HY256_11085 [Candidatus Sumerlaeota bacterium]|nr:hypothetical protein [Candidatus Sumerlaeota bacterium]
MNGLHIHVAEGDGADGNLRPFLPPEADGSAIHPDLIPFKIDRPRLRKSRCADKNPRAARVIRRAQAQAEDIEQVASAAFEVFDDARRGGGCGDAKADDENSPREGRNCARFELHNFASFSGAAGRRILLSHLDPPNRSWQVRKMISFFSHSWHSPAKHVLAPEVSRRDRFRRS